MRSINEQIKLIRYKKKIGLMTHVVAGYPSLEESEELVLQMQRAGVDFIEIQIPFSDSIADGATIMQANDKALKNQVTILDALALVRSLSSKVEIPLLFMAYYNSVFHYGAEKFCCDAQRVGVQGLIIPDMPIDEERHDHFLKYCKKYKLASIRVLSPTSTSERIIANIKVARGFIYCTAIAGTTGSRAKLDKKTQRFLTRIQQHTKLPLAVGFGISQPKHVQDLVGFAQIAVVGSAVINMIEAKGTVAAVQLVKDLVAAGE